MRLKITTKPSSKKLFANGRHRKGSTAWMNVSRGTQYYARSVISARKVVVGGVESAADEAAAGGFH